MAKWLNFYYFPSLQKQNYMYITYCFKPHLNKYMYMKWLCYLQMVKINSSKPIIYRHFLNKKNCWLIIWCLKEQLLYRFSYSKHTLQNEDEIITRHVLTEQELFGGLLLDHLLHHILSDQLLQYVFRHIIILEIINSWKKGGENSKGE